MMHPPLSDLELYVMGDGAADEVEAHLADCRGCMAVVRREARLELALLDVAKDVTECPSCRHATTTTRCANCGAALRAGDYRVIEVVVQNAHGRLYLAEDPAGHHVALKELAFVQAPGPEALAAFEREAKFLRALEHPHIPRFITSFQEGEGVATRLFLAQEYIDGESLQTRLADHWFDEDEALDTARKVLEILVYLQELSPMVVHGDVKPANLIQRRDGSIALVDFGAARAFHATITTAVGTFGYMPIEQLAGIVNPTTDLYGLGASLMHLMTREEPWKVLEDPAALGRMNITPELRRFLAKLTARRPGDRFANARTALAALEALRAPVVKRRRTPWLVAAIALGALVTGGAGFAIARLTMDEPAVSSEQPTEESSSDEGGWFARQPHHVPRNTFDFIALYPQNGLRKLASYSIDGKVDTLGTELALDITDVAHDPKSNIWYVIEDDVVGWFEPGMAFQTLETDDAPELWGPSALAFDTQRRRLVVVADDAENEHWLYAYDVDHKHWSQLANLGTITLDTLAYHPGEDRFYALMGPFLTVISADGKTIEHRSLPHSTLGAQLVVFDNRLYKVQSGIVSPLEVAADVEPALAPATYEIKPAKPSSEVKVRAPVPPTDEPIIQCDERRLRELGIENLRMGQHAAALSKFEAGLRCKLEPETLRLAFMEACQSGNAAKAKVYFKKLSATDKVKLAQICIRSHVPYE